MFDALTNIIWEAFKMVIENAANEMINSLVMDFTDSLSWATALIDTAYVKEAIKLSISIAASLLVLKIAVESLKTYILYNHGEPTDPGGFLMRVAISAAVMGTSPWLVVTVYDWGTTLANDVARIAGVSTDGVSAIGILVSAVNATWIVGLLQIAAAILWALILLQVCVRTIEVAVLAVSGPILSLGYLQENFGAAAGWWRELIIQATSQALQMFLIKGALVTLAYVEAKNPLVQIFLFLAWLWVAFKAPSVLRRYVYNSGIGGAVGGTVQQAGTLVIMRKMLTKGV